MLGVAVDLDGLAYLSAPHLTGSETVSSSQGTSTPTVSAGRVDFTPGTLWDLQLSDGSRYPISERAGIKIHDVSGGGNHGWFESVPSSMWITPDSDFLWELTHGANPALLCDGGGSLEVETPSQSLSTFTLAARITTAKPASSMVTEVHESLNSHALGDHLLSGVDLRASWQWVILTFDGTTAKTYVNGVVNGADAVAASSLVFSGKWFSALGSAANPFNASQFLGYSRVLSGGEITALSSAATIPASSQILNYQATHSKSDPIQDRSGSANGGAGMAAISIVNVPALAAKNGVDATGDTVFNPAYTRVPIAHAGDYPPYEEAVPIRGNAGEKRWVIVRTRNFEDGKAPSPELVQVVQLQF